MATLDLSFVPTPLRGGAPALQPGEAHIWRARLDGPLGPNQSLLSPVEQARAERMRHEGARASFLNARAALRLILGAYAERDPATLAIEIGPRGKPYLDGVDGLHFNLSHSGALALVAITRTAAVGVDIEFIRPLPRLDDIAARFFAGGEIAALNKLAEGDRADAFHACWTRKEAFVKAQGSGLANSLAHFEVSLTPGEPAMLVSLQGDRDAATGFSLHAFRPAADAWGAICVVAPGVEARGFDLVTS